MSSNSKPKEESLEKLEKFYHGLQQYCRFIARNQWDGDDLAQESFLRAVQRYPESDISPALLKKSPITIGLIRCARRRMNATECHSKCCQLKNKSHLKK